MAGDSDGNSSSSSSGGEFLPQDVMINILKRLPVKSLSRFNCVAKDWAKLFTAPHFISQHLHHSALHSPFLLLQRIPRPHPLPLTSSSSSSCLIGPNLKVCDSQFLDFTAGKIVGSCNGLLCFRHPDHTLSLCNPATRQVRQLPPSALIDAKKLSYVGFGFSPVVDDYRIVRISASEFGDDEDDHVVVLDDVRVSRVEVYSLAAGSWKEVDATNLRNLSLRSTAVAAGGAVFWLADVSSVLADPDLELVVSFDIGQEAFTLLKGPPPTGSDGNALTVYSNKLAVFRHYIMGNFESSSFDLWVLDSNTHTCADGGSWIKQCSVGPFSRILYPLRMIWEDEIVCLEELSGHDDEHSRVNAVLTLFNPYSNELKSLPALRDEYYYVALNYEESLVQVANTLHEQ